MTRTVLLAFSLLAAACAEFDLSSPPAPREVRVDGFAPLSAFAGELVTIRGAGFDPVASRNLVTFGTATAPATGYSVDGDAEVLTLRVPASLDRAPTPLVLETTSGRATSTDAFTFRGFGHLRQREAAGVASLASRVLAVADFGGARFALLDQLHVVAREKAAAGQRRFLDLDRAPFALQGGKRGLWIVGAKSGADVKLSLVDPATESSLGAVDLPRLPLSQSALAASPDGARCFTVLGADGGAPASLALASDEGASVSLTTVALPAGAPRAVAALGSAGAAAALVDKSLHLFKLSGTALSLEGTFALPAVSADFRYDALAARPDGCEVALVGSDERAGAYLLTTVALSRAGCPAPGPSPVRTAPLSTVGSFALYSADAQRLFVALGSTSVETFDPATLLPLVSVETGPRPGVLSNSADGSAVLVPHFEGSDLVTLSASTGLVTGRSRLRTRARCLSASEDATTLFVAADAYSALLDVDTASLAVRGVERLPASLGEIVDVARDPATGLQWLALEHGVAKRKREGSFATLSFPPPAMVDRMVFSGGSVWVVGAASETVSGEATLTELSQDPAVLRSVRVPVSTGSALAMGAAHGDGGLSLAFASFGGSRPDAAVAALPSPLATPSIAVLPAGFRFTGVTGHPAAGTHVFGVLDGGGPVGFRIEGAEPVPLTALVGAEGLVREELSSPRISPDGRVLYGFVHPADRAHGAFTVVPLDGDATQARSLPLDLAVSDLAIMRPKQIALRDDGERAFVLNPWADELVVYR